MLYLVFACCLFQSLQLAFNTSSHDSASLWRSSQVPGWAQGSMGWGAAEGSAVTCNFVKEEMREAYEREREREGGNERGMSALYQGIS